MFQNYKTYVKGGLQCSQGCFRKQTGWKDV